MSALNLSHAVWRKSTRSAATTGNCVEVATLGSTVAVRDSKNKTGPILTFASREWDAFLDGARAGEFA